MADFSPYVHSIQQVDFSIPLNQPSATYQLPLAVGNQALFIWDQEETTLTTSTSTSAASVALNPATGIVTATRNGLAAAIIIRGEVLDFKAVLVDSAEYKEVTIAISATSGTVACTNTNDSYTSCIFLGYRGTTTTFGCSSVLPRVAKSGALITATRAVSAVASLTVGCVNIKWNSAAIVSLQNISRSWTATPTQESFTITSVNPNNTVCFYGGGTLANNNARMAMQRGQLIDATTFQIDINVGALGAAAVYNTSIVEFVAGTFSQPVQRGVITISTTSNTATITALGTFGAVNYLGQSTGNATASYNTCLSSLKRTNSTTITASRGTATGTSLVSWEAIDFSIATPTVSILGKTTIKSASIK